MTDLPRGAGAPVWSPDGKRIAFSSTTQSGRCRRRGPAAPRRAKSDVRVITQRRLSQQRRRLERPGSCRRISG